jgi:hypothetical protein
VIALCDFGGSGTSLTLVDAANGFQRIGATVRHADFSGDLIDQALLNHVVADLSAAGSFDTSATSAIGSLTRLRADCRHAKEQLSVNTVATMTVDLRGYHGDLHLTRAELDEAIRQPLATFISVIRNVLQNDDDTGISPLLTGEYPAQAAQAGVASGPPPARFDEDARQDPDGSAAVPWYRRTVVLIIAAALVLLAIAGAIMFALRNTSGTTPVTPTPSVTTGPGGGTSAPAGTAPQNPTETQPSTTNQPPSTTSESPSSTQSTTTTTEPSTQTSTSQVTTTQPPLFPNRPIGPDFPRRPNYSGPGEGPGVQEPGREGR